MSDRTYTPRPVYETSRTLEAERKTMERFAKAYSVDFYKLPRFYRIDWGLTSKDSRKVVGWAECKRRHVARDAYSSFIISLGKLMHGIELYEKTGLPITLVVEWNDGIGYYKLRELDDFEIEVGGRFDRGDSEDQEPLVHIPVSKFTFIS